MKKSQKKKKIQVSPPKQTGSLGTHAYRSVLTSKFSTKAPKNQSPKEK